MICQKQNTHLASKFVQLTNTDTASAVNAQRKRYPHGVIGQRNNNSLV